MPQDKVQPTDDGFWPILVIEGQPVEGQELPAARCRLVNDGSVPLPVFDNGQLSRLVGLAFTHLALSAIKTEEALGMEDARDIIAVLVREAGQSALDAVDAHLAGDAVHEMGNEGGIG